MFNIFINSTTAYANEVMDNFYFIADGTRLPRGAGSMTAVDSTYNIGSSANRWKNLYANNLYVNNSITSSSIIRHVSASFNTITSRIAITGLNGDSTDYMFQLSTTPTTASISIQFYMNQDTSTNNYNYKKIGYESTVGTVFVSDFSSGNGSWLLFNTFLNTTGSFFFGTIHAKTGSIRILNGFEQSGANTKAYKSVYTWDNKLDTFTSLSITFTGENPQTRFDLWSIS